MTPSNFLNELKQFISSDLELYIYRDVSSITDDYLEYKFAYKHQDPSARFKENGLEQSIKNFVLKNFPVSFLCSDNKRFLVKKVRVTDEHIKEYTFLSTVKITFLYNPLPKNNKLKFMSSVIA